MAYLYRNICTSVLLCDGGGKEEQWQQRYSITLDDNRVAVAGILLYCVYVCVLYKKIHTCTSTWVLSKKERQAKGEREAASSSSEREKNGHDFHF